jgi:hypothetical protein
VVAQAQLEDVVGLPPPGAAHAAMVPALRQAPRNRLAARPGAG